jgi:hypothetical protein
MKIHYAFRGGTQTFVKETPTLHSQVRWGVGLPQWGVNAGEVNPHSVGLGLNVVRGFSEALEVWEGVGGGTFRWHFKSSTNRVSKLSTETYLKGYQLPGS